MLADAWLESNMLEDAGKPGGPGCGAGLRDGCGLVFAPNRLRGLLKPFGGGGARGIRRSSCAI